MHVLFPYCLNNQVQSIITSEYHEATFRLSHILQDKSFSVTFIYGIRLCRTKPLVIMKQCPLSTFMFINRQTSNSIFPKTIINSFITLGNKKQAFSDIRFFEPRLR